MIRTDGLTKAFGTRRAVDALDLDVRAGEMYGFLGPNGAGKTTTIRLLLGLIPPTSGQIWLRGLPVRGPAHPGKARVGVVAEREDGMNDLSAWEYLEFFAALYQVRPAHRRIGTLLDALGLAARGEERLCTYSRGMRQKLELARALLHDPDVLLLDEPTSGLDPHGVRQVRDLLREENQRGRTIFLSSHLLSEIEQTCHRVGILVQGRLVAQDEPARLKAALAPTQHLEIELEAAVPSVADALVCLPDVRDVRQEGRRLWITARPEGDIRPAVSRALGACGAVILRMVATESSLEDVFIALTDHTVDLATRDA